MFLHFINLSYSVPLLLILSSNGPNYLIETEINDFSTNNCQRIEQILVCGIWTSPPFSFMSFKNDYFLEKGRIPLTKFLFHVSKLEGWVHNNLSLFPL